MNPGRLAQAAMNLSFAVLAIALLLGTAWTFATVIVKVTELLVPR